MLSSGKHAAALLRLAIALWHVAAVMLPHALGAAQADVAHDAISLSTYGVSKSIVNFGDPALFRRVHEKLTERQCVHVLAIGGSVSLGIYLPYPYNETGQWHRVFTRLMDARYPCLRRDGTPGAHQLTVLVKGGVSSLFWNEVLSSQEGVLLAGVDLVLVDTAVNDMGILLDYEKQRSIPQHDGYVRDPETPEAHAEIMLGLLLHQTRQRNDTTTDTNTNVSNNNSSMNRTWFTTQQHSCGENARAWTGTAVLHVATTTRVENVETGNFTPLGMAMHLPIAQHHGVPYLYPMQALGMFDTPQGVNWLVRHWYHDKIHPTLIGQHIIGSVTASFVSWVHEHLMTSRLWRETEGNKDDGLGAYYCPRAPKFTTQERLGVYVDGRGLEMLQLRGPNPAVWAATFLSRKASPCQHWEIYADIPGKLGLISSTVGSTCDLSVTPAELASLGALHSLHVLFLKSYEHMGVLAVSLSYGPARADGTCPPTMMPTTPTPQPSSSCSNSSCTNANNSVNLSPAGANQREAVITRWEQLGSPIKIDCVWHNAYSEPLKAELPIKMPPSSAVATAGGGGVAAAAAGHSCLYVSLSVESTNRTENKVKVLSLTLHGL